MEKLGISPIQLIAQIINFVIMIVVLKKLLYQPILTALENRRKKIEEGLNYSEKMKQELEKVEKKKTEILEEAKKEARGVLEDSKKTAEGVRIEILEKAQTEAKAIIEKGKKDVEQERKDMEYRLELETVEVASQMAAKALEDVLTAADQKTIIEKKLKKAFQTLK